MSGFELYCFLKSKNLLKDYPKHWWKNAGTIWCLISTILSQNTKFENVEKSMKNLENFMNLDLENFENIDIVILSKLITPSGFKNQKAQRIKLLTKNILTEFNSFDNFIENVSREWLLTQKGIGYETADSILCYVCFREILVIDKYTQKLLSKNGLEFFDYNEIQNYLQNEILDNWDKISKENENNLNLCFARFHGMIVEYMKNSKNLS